MQQQPASSFSGGWLMRISLAKALFCNPDILIMDEPTNHLDFHALIWLKNFLQTFTGTIIVVAHQQRFLEEVCNTMVVMEDHTFHTFHGDYQYYKRCIGDLDRQVYVDKEFKKKTIKDCREFIANHPESENRVNGIIKMLESSESLYTKHLDFSFDTPEFSDSLLIDTVDCSFRYTPESPLLIKNLNLSIGRNSRIALVGKNGCGKTTLLKLLSGELQPTSGIIGKSGNLRTSVFSQQFVDQLDLDMTPLDYLHQLFPTVKEIRPILDRYGIPESAMTHCIRFLSGGQKSRLVFAKIALEKPHIILADEPSNHLDIQAVESLCKGLGLFEGALFLVSHDEQLIETVCDEVWYFEDEEVLPWKGSIQEYKTKIIEELEQA